MNKCNYSSSETEAFFSPLFSEDNYGYLRKIKPEDLTEAEDKSEGFEYGYFSADGTIIAAGTNEQVLINQINEENMMFFLLN